MRLVDNLKVFLLFLGVIQLCPAPGIINNFPCVIAALGGYLLVDRNLENIRREEEAECNVLLTARRRNFCNLMDVDDANFNTCLECLAASTEEACTAASANNCDFVNGICGPNTNIASLPA